MDDSICTKFIEDMKQYKTSQLSDMYGKSKRTIRRWKSECRGTIPAASSKRYDDFMVVEAERALVLGDVEVPCHHAGILEAACDVAQKYNTDTLIINGDFIALDSFSTWARSTACRAFFKEEIEPAYNILITFLKVFKRVCCVTGNHERRLAHRVEGEFTVGELFTMRTGVEFSEYAYCTLISGDKEILVVHQDNYSKQPLAVARELASIHHKNIIAGHTHHQAFGYDKSGKYWIVDGGCARDMEHTGYKKLRVNTFPMWNLGFTMVLHGQPYLINMDNLDLWLA